MPLPEYCANPECGCELHPHDGNFCKGCLDVGPIDEAEENEREKLNG